MKAAADVHASPLLILANEPEFYIEGLIDESQNLVAAELHSLMELARSANACWL